MQFKIWHLFAAMLFVAVLCGLVFAAPPMIGMLSLTLFLLVCPAIWFSGAIFARGSLQAFFIGGIAGGVTPYIVGLYISVLTCFSLFGGGGVMFMPVYAGQSGNPEDVFWMPAVRSGWWLMNLVTLLPGPFSFVGGGISVLVYRWVLPKRRTATSEVHNRPPSPHFGFDGVGSVSNKVESKIELDRGVG